MITLVFVLMMIAAQVAPAAPGLSSQAPESPQSPEARDQGFRVEIDVTGRGIKRTEREWIELKSQNFLVAGDADEKDLRMAASELELFRTQFARVFPRAGQPSTTEMRVIVLRDASSVQELLPEEPETGGRAYLHESADINYLVLKGGDKLSRDLIRAYVRVLASDSLGPAPLWFQEGMAEYFSNYKLERLGDDRLIRLGLDDYKGKISDRNLIPFETLFSVTRTQLDGLPREEQDLFRWQSCALFTYLIEARRMSAALRFFNTMAEGRPVAESFRNSFKLPLSTFQENVRRSIQASRTYGWTATFAGLTLDPDKRSIRVFYANAGSPMNIPLAFDAVGAGINALPVRVLSEAERLSYRGDLLLHTGRFDESEGFLRRAIELNPEQAGAHASLALLHMSMNNYAAARSSIDRAAELSPDDYLIHYYSALLSQDTGSDFAQMERNLRRVVALAPQFVAASELLAETILASRGDLGEASRILTAGLRRAAGRESLLLVLAHVAEAGGDRASAGWILQRIVAGGDTDPMTRGRAEQLLSQLNLTAEEQTAFGEFAILAEPEAENVGTTIRLSLKKAKTEVTDEHRHVRGYLTKVDCSKGLTLHFLTGTPPLPQTVKSDERIENVHTDNPASIDWVTDTGEERSIIACGTAAGRVMITYRPKRKGLTLGEPVVVQYLTLPDPGYR